MPETAAPPSAGGTVNLGVASVSVIWDLASLSAADLTQRVSVASAEAGAAIARQLTGATVSGMEGAGAAAGTAAAAAGVVAGEAMAEAFGGTLATEAEAGGAEAGTAAAAALTGTAVPGSAAAGEAAGAAFGETLTASAEGAAAAAAAALGTGLQGTVPAAGAAGASAGAAFVESMEAAQATANAGMTMPWARRMAASDWKAYDEELARQAASAPSPALAKRVLANFDGASRSVQKRLREEAAKITETINGFKAKRDEELGRIAALQMDGVLRDPARVNRLVQSAKQEYYDALRRTFDRSGGDLKQGAFITLTREMKSAGEAVGVQFGEGVGDAAEKTTSKRMGGIFQRGGTMMGLMAAAMAIRAVLTNMWKQADGTAATERKLGAEARTAGIDIDSLAGAVARAEQKLNLSHLAAERLVTEIATLSQKSGDVGKMGPAVGAMLDVAISRGMTLEESLKAIGGLARLSAADIEAVFGKNKDQLDREYAARHGVVAKLSEQQQAEAILEETVLQGESARGAYLQYLETEAGRLEIATLKANEHAAALGDATASTREMARTTKDTLVLALEGLLAAVGWVIAKFQAMIQWIDAADARFDRWEAKVARRLGLTSLANSLVDPTTGKTVSEKMETGMGTIVGDGPTPTTRRTPAPASNDQERGARIAAEMETQKRRLGAMRDEAEAAVKVTEATRGHTAAIAVQNRERAKLNRQALEYMNTLKAMGAQAPQLAEIASFIQRQDTPVRAPGQGRAEAARQQLAEMVNQLKLVRQFTDAAGQPYASLDAMPQRLREAVEQATRLQGRIDNIDDLVHRSQRAAPAAIAAQRAQLERDLDALLDRARRIAAEPGLLATTAAENAQRELRTLTEGFEQLQRMGAGSLARPTEQMRGAFREMFQEGQQLAGDIPQAFVQAANAVTAKTQEIARVEAQLRRAREEGVPEDDPAVRRAELYLGTLKQERVELAQQADALVNIRDILDSLPEVTAELFKGLSPQNIAAMQEMLRHVAVATDAVRAAELRVEMARGRGPLEQIRAEAALTQARAHLREQTEALLRALDTLGIRGKSALTIMKALHGVLSDNKVDPEVDLWHRWANAIIAAAQGLEQVGDALGKISGESREALNGLVSVLEGASDLAKGIGTHDAASGIAGAAELVTGLIHIAHALWGTSEEAKRLHATQSTENQELIVALVNLRQALLENLSRTQADADAASAGRAASYLSGDKNTFDEDNAVRRREALRGLAVNLGVASAETEKMQAIALLADWAKQFDARYGTNLTSYIQNSDPEGLLRAFRQLPAAIQTAIGRMGQFGNDVKGIMDRVTWELQAMGHTDALERLRAVVKALAEAGKGAGEFQAQLTELASLDLTTAEGRAKRDELIKAMIAQLDAGGANIGDYTVAELRELIAGFGAAAGTGTGVVAGDETPRANVSETVVQAEATIAYLSTMTYHLANVSANTAFLPRIYGLLAGMPSLTALPTFAAADAAPLTQGGGVVFNLGPITQQFTFGSSVAAVPEVVEGVRAAGQAAASDLANTLMVKYTCAGQRPPLVVGS